MSAPFLRGRVEACTSPIIIEGAPGYVGNFYFKKDCRTCVIAAGALATNKPAQMTENVDTGEFMLMADRYDQVRHLHELPALPGAAS